jgi:Ca-activated chloride channel family protein
MLRCLLVFLILSALPEIVQSQKQFSLQKSQGSDYTLSMNVNEVVLHATVQNSKGMLISGLGKEDFHVYEDGVLQQIRYFSHEDIPVTVGLVVDNSGSMASKRTDVLAAASAFVRSSNPNDQMFVVTFNENVYFGLPAGVPFTDNAAQLQAALSHIAASGETALYDAVAAALEHLKTGDRDNKELIVISDGGDNASKRKLAEVRAMAGRPDAIIYTIGLFDKQDGDQNPHVLKQLARDTGGEAFLPDSSKDVVPICEQIAHDIRNQYTIAYTPTNPKTDGTYRAVQVKVDAPHRGRLSVRTRTGYYTSLQTQSQPTANVAHHAAYQ